MNVRSAQDNNWLMYDEHCLDDAFWILGEERKQKVLNTLYHVWLRNTNKFSSNNENKLKYVFFSFSSIRVSWDHTTPAPYHDNSITTTTSTSKGINSQGRLTQQRVFFYYICILYGKYIVNIWIQFICYIHKMMILYTCIML